MDRRIGWGILGTGGIARLFTADIQGVGLHVAAVGSRAQGSAEAFGREFGVPERHPSYEALCADPAVDVVYVATPHPFHCENALLALRSGKHVLVEKPFTVNAREARSLVDEARSRGLVLMEAMWTRFLPTMVALRDIIGSGGLGEVRAVIADHNQYLPLERAKRLHLPELGGGALLDLGVYPVSFAHMLLGPPAKVLATAKLTELGVDEDMALALEWESGSHASLHCGMMAAGPNRAAVIGSRGWVEIERVWYCQADFTHYSTEGQVLRRFSERVPGRGMQCQALEVERLLREGKTESPHMGLEASLEVMGIMDEARRQCGVRYPSE